MVQYRDRTFGKFDVNKPLVAQRQMTLLGESLKPGDPLPEATDVGIGRRLWLSHHATYAEDFRPTAEQATHGSGREWMDEAEGVSVTEGENGWFTVHAAWLGEEGEKVRGAEAAEARAAEVRAEGDTKGITYAHSGGGYYLITGPGVPENTKVKGEEAAKAKVAELRAGAQPSETPETDHKAEVEADGDDFLVKAPWLETPERFASEDDAKARADALNVAGPPEGWTPAPAETEGA